MDSFFDSTFWPVFWVLCGSAALFAVLFYLLWGNYWGPKRITSAIKNRMAPTMIRDYLTRANWLALCSLSLLLGGGLTLISWRYFGEWVADAATDTLTSLVATWFWNSLGVHKFHDPDLAYTPFIPIACIFALIIGVLIGALLGKRIGVRHAALKYHLTKNLFPKRRS